MPENCDTTLEATLSDYEEFLNECLMQGSLSVPEDATDKYVVHFWCDRCQESWSVKVPMIQLAAADVVRKGCPKCKIPDKVMLVHHTESTSEKGEVDIAEFIKVVPY